LYNHDTVSLVVDVHTGSARAFVKKIMHFTLYWFCNEFLVKWHSKEALGHWAASCSLKFFWS